MLLGPQPYLTAQPRPSNLDLAVSISRIPTSMPQLDTHHHQRIFHSNRSVGVFASAEKKAATVDIHQTNEKKEKRVATSEDRSSVAIGVPVFFSFGGRR
ncbi:unnamed protein product [Linum trigynum]|uniref:Uncharacterized protein n=1 Tax=Linum trigynum TaxID=586398 RepID=A0AAV2D6M1_9ROSI